MFEYTGLAPWEIEFPLPCSLTSTFLYLDLHVHSSSGATRWSHELSSKVNMLHAIDFGGLHGAHLVTLRSKFRPNETRVLHRAVRGEKARERAGERERER
jgi:hypothetical protein